MTTDSLEMPTGPRRLLGPCRGMAVRRRPTLPPRLRSSTIGAERLSFRVRNGSGRFPLAMAAVTLCTCANRGVRLVRSEPHSGRELSSFDRLGAQQPVDRVCGQVLGLLVPVSCTPCGASTSGLSTRWSGGGLTRFDPVRDLILKRASRLDAFSGYPCRT